MTDATSDSPADLDAAIDRLSSAYGQLKEQMGRVIVGQEEVVDQLLIALFSRGHCLLEGVPGLAKTLMISTLSKCLSMTFSRIQFTPDLMPADITGTDVLQTNKDTGEREFRFLLGPLFHNIVLADEINRTPPKTQAALLEAMQEHQVTAAGKRYALPEPFFVLATQNPIEMEGTYPLPEAQLDRFLFNVHIGYLPEDDEVAVVRQTTQRRPEPIEPLFDAADVIGFHEIVRRMPIAEPLVRYAVQIAAASRPGRDGASDFVNQSVSWGAGLRAAQSLVLGAKARALLGGHSHVRADDIDALALPTLRHRVLLSYRAEADGVRSEDLVAHLIESIARPVA